LNIVLERFYTRIEFCVLGSELDVFIPEVFFKFREFDAEIGPVLLDFFAAALVYSFQADGPFLEAGCFLIEFFPEGLHLR